MTATLHEPAIDLEVASATPAGFRLVAFGPTGPDVLAAAAAILPQVSSRLPLAGDIHAALVEALRRLGGGVGRYHRLRLADEAVDMFAAYLVWSGRARQEPRVSATVRGWVVFQDLAGARVALATAAGFWRAELSPRMSDVGPGW